jgi:WD40-like Beta Propeller Repeat
MTTIHVVPALGLCALLIAAAPARGQQFSEWSQPINLGPVVNSSGGDFFPAISKDGLSLYFTSSRSVPGAQGGWDIYVSQRSSVHDEWGPARNLGPTINTPFNEGAPVLSIDGHRMYFSSNRPGGFGGNDIYVSRRHDKRDDFGWQAPVNIGGNVNTSANEASPAIFDDDEAGVRMLYFDSNRPGGLGPFGEDGANNGNDIYSSMLLSDETFAPPQLVAELSTVFLDRQPTIRRDGLEIFFASNRPVDGSALDLWMSTRATPWDPWGTPVKLPPHINRAGAVDAGPALSFDGTTLYFHSAGSVGGSSAFDLFAVTRTKLKGRDNPNQE